MLGADQLAALGSWHRPDRVRELARVAVAARPGAPHAGDAEELVMQPVAASSSRDSPQRGRGRRVSDLVPAGGGRGDRAARGCTARPRARLIAIDMGIAA